MDRVRLELTKPCIPRRQSSVYWSPNEVMARVFSCAYKSFATEQSPGGIFTHNEPKLAGSHVLQTGSWEVVLLTDEVVIRDVLVLCQLSYGVMFLCQL